MAVDVTLNNISSGYNLTKLNENFTAIQTALQDAVSRSANGPNTLTADLDMNSKFIINLPDPTSAQHAVTKSWAEGRADSAAADAAAAAASAAASASSAATALGTVSSGTQTYSSSSHYTIDVTTQLTVTGVAISDENSIQVTFAGATQHHDKYSVAISGSDTIITFTAAIPTTSVEVQWSFHSTSIITASDSTFSIQDDVDDTKVAQFQLSGITTGNTRTMTVPDAGGTLVLDTAGLSALTTAEVDQLENIGTSTISAAQWGYVGASSAAYTSTEATKLAGIETAATADQTGTEIKALYELEANAFTDTQFTKLAGIEALADVTDSTNVLAAINGQSITPSNVDGILGATTPSNITGLATDVTTLTASGVVKSTASGSYAAPQLQLVSSTYGIAVDGSGNTVYKNANNGAHYFPNSGNTNNSLAITDAVVGVTAASFTAVAGAFSSTLSAGAIATTGTLVVTAGHVQLENAAGPIILNETASATNPTLIPNRGYLGTGIGSASANVLTLIAASTEQVSFSGASGSELATFVKTVSYGGSVDGATTGSAQLIGDETATDTNPTLIPYKSAVTTGVGGTATSVSLIVSSTAGLTLDSSQNATFAGAAAMSNAAGPTILNEAATATNPVFCPNKIDKDTGIGWTSANIGSLIADGQTRLSWSAANVTISSLAGTGTRNVVVDANGVMSAP